MYAPKFQYLWRPEALGPPGTRVTEILRKPHMGAKSQTLSSVRAISPAHF